MRKFAEVLLRSAGQMQCWAPAVPTELQLPGHGMAATCGRSGACCCGYDTLGGCSGVWIFIDPRTIAGHGGYHCSMRMSNSGAEILPTLSTAGSLIQVILSNLNTKFQSLQHSRCTASFVNASERYVSSGCAISPLHCLLNWCRRDN